MVNVLCCKKRCFFRGGGNNLAFFIFFCFFFFFSLSSFACSLAIFRHLAEFRTLLEWGKNVPKKLKMVSEGMENFFFFFSGSRVFFTGQGLGKMMERGLVVEVDVAEGGDFWEE